jgi:hypothetical protein
MRGLETRECRFGEREGREFVCTRAVFWILSHHKSSFFRWLWIAYKFLNILLQRLDLDICSLAFLDWFVVLLGPFLATFWAMTLTTNLLCHGYCINTFPDLSNAVNVVLLL